MSQSPYFGSYTIRLAQNCAPPNTEPVVAGATVTIEPNDDGRFAVAVTNCPVWSTNFDLGDGYLFKDVTVAYEGNDAPCRMQISQVIGDNGFKTLYATFVVTDPQQVGVWGADNGG